MTTVTNFNLNPLPSCHADYENCERQSAATTKKLANGYFKNSKNLPDFDRIHDLDKFRKSLHQIQCEYHHDTEVINSLASVENFQKDLSNLLRRNCFLPKEQIFSLIKERIVDNEITESGKRTVPLIINEILLQRGALRTLQEEGDRWRNIPIEAWPKKFPHKKVFFLINDQLCFSPIEKFKEMCCSKDYKEIIAFKTNLYLVHNVKKFEESLHPFEQRYSYDQKVVDAIKKTKEVRQNISEMIKRNPDCPLKLFPFYIISAIAKEVKDSSKTNLIASIVQAVLLERGMIRRQLEEVDRWKEVPIEEWPSEFKKNGVSFLDDSNEVKHCSIDDFKKLVAQQKTVDKVTFISGGILLASVTIGAIAYFFKN